MPQTITITVEEFDKAKHKAMNDTMDDCFDSTRGVDVMTVVGLLSGLVLNELKVNLFGKEEVPQQ